MKKKTNIMLAKIACKYLGLSGFNS